MDGITVSVEPVIFRLGPITVRWFGVFLIAAFGLGLWLTSRRAAALGVSAGKVFEAASWVLLWGLLCARVFNVAEHWEYYFTRPGDLFELSARGLNVWGGIFGGALAVRLWARRLRPRAAVLGDAAAPGVVLGDALGRFAAFLNGDGQGVVADVPWATAYTSSDTLAPELGVFRHPAQLYQLAADMAILAMLWASREVVLPAGFRFWIFLMSYGLSRLLIGLVRLDPPFVFGLQQGQLLGILAVLLSSFVMIRAVVRPRGPRPASAPAR